MPHAWPVSEPTEVHLASGSAQLWIDLDGGGLRRLVVGNWDVLDGYAAGAVRRGSRGAVLLPWPNRLRNGRWTWQGRELQLDVRSMEQPHALHGLVSGQSWTALEEAADR